MKITESLVKVSWIEYLLIVWIVSFSFRLIYEVNIYIFKKKLNYKIKKNDYKVLNYFTITKIWNKWNYFNLFGCILFFIAIIIRNTAIRYKSIHSFKAAKIILCVDLLIWFFRSLFFLNCFASLGPKIVMILKMVNLLIYILIWPHMARNVY